MPKVAPCLLFVMLSKNFKLSLVVIEKSSKAVSCISHFEGLVGLLCGRLPRLSGIQGIPFRYCMMPFLSCIVARVEPTMYMYRT